MFTGSSIGGVVLPIMLSHLIRSLGFGWALRICAFVILGLLIIACMTVRSFYPPRPHKVTWPELAKPFTELQFVILAVAFFCLAFGGFAPINYLPLQALSTGMNPQVAQYLLSILNGASMFGRLFSGFLGDEIGIYNSFLIASYASCIWILTLWLLDVGDAALIAFAALFGFFSGASIPMLTPMIMQVSPLAELGFRIGIMSLIISVGGLVTNPICGAILDSSSRWADVKIFAGVFCLAGTSFMLVARIRNTGWKIFARF